MAARRQLLAWADPRPGSSHICRSCANEQLEIHRAASGALEVRPLTRSAGGCTALAAASAGVFFGRQRRSGWRFRAPSTRPAADALFGQQKTWVSIMRRLVAIARTGHDAGAKIIALLTPFVASAVSARTAMDMC